MTADRLRIGVLGAAKIVPRSILGPARERRDVEVVAVAARERSRAEAFAQEHGVAVVAASYAELLRRDDVDLVHVALPPSLHAAWSIRALKAGKAVLCEKPFALDAAEAVAMVRAAEAASRPLIEAFHYRFHPGMAEVLRLISDGAIGRPCRGEAVFRVAIPYSPAEFRWDAAMGGGALMDLGCYCVHALRLAARAEPRVRSAAAVVVHGVDETTSAELEFAEGFVGRLEASMADGGLSAGLRVEGETGAIELTNFIAPQLGSRLTLRRGDEAHVLPVAARSSFAFQLDHVVEVLRGGAPQLTGGADAIRTMQAIDDVRARCAPAFATAG